jgi:hypothetical protein
LIKQLSASIHLQAIQFGDKSTMREEEYISCNLKSFVHGNDNLKKSRIKLSFAIDSKVL